MKLPPDITLEVTAKCNFACPFCYCVWHESTAPPPKDMSADEWKKILDLCAEHKVKSVTFSGGEALLRKDLPELITYAKEVLPQAVLGVFTNNSRMTEEFFFFCKENKVLLSTSLQGLQSYGMMTGTKRKYHRTLKLLTFAAENDWRFSVSLTATQANKHEFADMFCACAVSGVSHISMGPVMVQGRGRNHIELALSWEEWNTLKKRIRQLPNGNTPYSFSDEMLCICREQPAELLARFAGTQHSPCPAGKNFGVISPDGKFRQCLHTVKEFEISGF